MVKTVVEQTDAIQQYNLGEMFESGRVVVQIDEEAARWYRMAA